MSYERLKFVKLDKNNVEDCIRGWIAAFPNWKYSDALEAAKKQVSYMSFFGAYEDNIYKGLIVGAETSFNFRGKVLKGFELDHLHTEPLYRKSGISKFLIDEFEKHAVKSGHHMINVGPFNTEFYRNMGYGFGSKVMSFKSKPESFQYFDGATDSLEYYTGENYRQEVENFIRNQRTQYHGSFNYKDLTLEDKFEKLRDKNHITIISICNNKVSGVISYKASRNIEIDDFFFNKPLAAQALSSYLHSLKGNIESIKINCTQPTVLTMCNRPYDICLKEESMVKVINTRKFIEEIKDIDFKAEDIVAEFNLFDSLTKESESIIVQCKDGRLSVADNCNISDCVKVSMNLSDFTSMLFSQQTFKTYVSTGLATIGDENCVSTINSLFSYEDTPYNI